MIILDKKGHLVSTVSEGELHNFAKSIRLKTEWYQDGEHPHYDLTTPNAIQRAIRAGAKMVTSKEIIEFAWWNKND